jgi:hypothetical protein
MKFIPYIIDGKLPDKNEISSLLSLHGALLFRNFGLATKNDFASFVKKIIGQDSFLDYTGGTSPRENLGDGVYTSTKMPFFLKIPLHSEMAYRKYFPRKIFFFCEKAPLFGGETPVVDIRRVYQEIPVNLREKIESQGIKYYRHLKNDTAIRKLLSVLNPMIETGTWQFVFKTTDRKVVGEYCLKNSFLAHWQIDGSVILETHLPASFLHPESQQMTWFNSFHFFQVHHRIWGRLLTSCYKIIHKIFNMKDLDARLGAGQKLSSNEISVLVDAYEKNSSAGIWKKGDVLFLDNTITAHGRNPYLGRRKILVALAQEGEFSLL